MGTEIERKFLVKNSWRPMGLPQNIIQGYLSLDPERIVRIRTVDAKEAFLTIKGRTVGIERPEFEYSIPFSDAVLQQKLCVGNLIHKCRYNEMPFTVDIFTHHLSGLVLAEIELDYESQPFVKPEWLGEEVSDNPKFYNSNLVYGIE